MPQTATSGTSPYYPPRAQRPTLPAHQGCMCLGLSIPTTFKITKEYFNL